jgi:hypothetical protein
MYARASCKVARLVPSRSMIGWESLLFHLGLRARGIQRSRPSLMISATPSRASMLQ